MAHNPPPGTVALAPPGHAAGHDADGSVLFDVPEDDDVVEESFDALSLRDVAAARYQRQHDIMAEVLASPYAIEELRPVDLDLNRVIQAALTVLEDDAPPKGSSGSGRGGSGVNGTTSSAATAASKKDTGASTAANTNAAAAAPAAAGADKVTPAFAHADRPPAGGDAQPGAAAAAGPATSVLARAQAERKSLVARAQAALEAFPAQRQRMEEEHEATVKSFRDRCAFWAEAERRLRNAEWDPDSFFPTSSLPNTVTTTNAATTGTVAESLLHSKGALRTAQARDDTSGGSENAAAAAAAAAAATAAKAKVERVADVIRDVERATRKEVYARDEVVLIHSGGLDAEHPYLPRFLARYPAGRHQIPTFSSSATATTTTAITSSSASSSLAVAKPQSTPLSTPPPPPSPLPDGIEINL